MLPAARRAATGRTTAMWRADVRTLFTVLLVVVLAGLAYSVAIGLVHR